jgi:hypothetical protein
MFLALFAFKIEVEDSGFNEKFGNVLHISYDFFIFSQKPGVNYHDNSRKKAQNF